MGVELAEDRFDVRFDSSQTVVAEILRTIRDLGYSPEVVGAASKHEGAEPTWVDPSQLPQELKALLANAGEGRLVLLDFFAPG